MNAKSGSKKARSLCINEKLKRSSHRDKLRTSRNQEARLKMKERSSRKMEAGIKTLGGMMIKCRRLSLKIIPQKMRR
jgi:hypothetical protein